MVVAVVVVVVVVLVSRVLFWGEGREGEPERLGRHFKQIGFCFGREIFMAVFILCSDTKSFSCEIY